MTHFSPEQAAAIAGSDDFHIAPTAPHPAP